MHKNNNDTLTISSNETHALYIFIYIYIVSKISQRNIKSKMSIRRFIKTQ